MYKAERDILLHMRTFNHAMRALNGGSNKVTYKECIVVTITDVLVCTSVNHCFYIYTYKQPLYCVVNWSTLLRLLKV